MFQLSLSREAASNELYESIRRHRFIEVMISDGGWVRRLRRTVVCAGAPKPRRGFSRGGGNLGAGGVGEHVEEQSDLVGEMPSAWVDSENRKFFGLMIRQQGHEPTLEAEDGPSALNLLRSDLKIDLLVTDVGLPNGMNGRQLADAARFERPGLKITFITAYAENSLLSNGQLDAGMAVSTKPFAVEALSAKADEMIGDVAGTERPEVR